MRILNYCTPRELVRHGTTPLGQVLLRLGLFLGVSAAVYFVMWMMAVYFVGRLLSVPN